MNDFLIIVCFLVLTVYSFAGYPYKLQILNFLTKRLYVKTIISKEAGDAFTLPKPVVLKLLGCNFCNDINRNL